MNFYVCVTIAAFVSHSSCRVINPVNQTNSTMANTTSNTTQIKIDTLAEAIVEYFYDSLGDYINSYFVKRQKYTSYDGVDSNSSIVDSNLSIVDSNSSIVDNRTKSGKRVKRQTQIAGKFSDAAKMPQNKLFKIFMLFLKNLWSFKYVGAPHPFHLEAPKTAVKIWKRLMFDQFFPDDL